MAVYNLPAVNRQIIDPREIATWAPLQGLDTLSRALLLDRDNVRPQDLKSIPDAWAQIQLSTDALLDRDHDAHKEVRSQWRGLLALFALQPSYSAEYTLDLHTVEIGRDIEGGSRLRNVLTELVPEASIAEDLGWRHIALVDILEANGRSFPSAAMLSPTTLVAPGRMLSKLQLSVPWAQSGVSDPVQGATLPAHEWHILTSYLEGLLAMLREGGHRAGAVGSRERLIREVELFADDCASRRAGEPQLEERVVHQDWPNPFFAALGQTFLVAIQQSECRVALPAAAGRGLFEGVILIDPGLAATLNRPAASILVWKRYTLAQATSPATLAQIRDEAAREGFLVLEPEDFFTDRLAKLGSDAEVPAHPESLRHHLLPLAPTALLFFESTSDLARNVSSRAKGDGVEVALNLHLQPADGGEAGQHTVRRSYARNDIAAAPAPDDLALWPNIESPDWPWTFLRFRYRPDKELQTRFAVSAELISADLRKASGRDRTVRFEEWSARTALAPEARLVTDRISTFTDAHQRLLWKRARFSQDEIIGEQHRLTVPVQAICFALRSKETGRDGPAGIALVIRAEPAGVASEALVSIDFGTTNTIAYARVEGRASERILLKDRVFFPVEYKRDKALLAGEYTDFFCLDPHVTPIPTVAKRRIYTNPLGQTLRIAVEQGSPEVGLTHHIFFMPELDGGVDPFLLMQLINEGQLEFQLKWGDTPRTRHTAQAFLHQLMIMAAAELLDRGVAPSRIRWRFSYPQAFSRVQRGDLQSILDRCRRQILNDTRDTEDSAAVGPEAQDAQTEAELNAFRMTTEGEAAAAYFSYDEEQANQGLGRLFLTLDIGGGTTDLALRLDHRLVWRGSIQIAGSDFFRRYLVRNLDVLKAIEPAALEQLDEQPSDQRAQINPTMRREQLVDLIVAKRGFGAQFAEKYPIYRSDPTWAGLRQCAVTALGGMMYYAGLVLRLLVDTGVLRKEDLSREITVALGGRGSTFFRTLDHGGSDSDLARVCSLAASAAGKAPGDLQFLPRFSQRPKEEVARGLLLDRPWQQGDREVSLALPVGLTLAVERNGERSTIAPSEPVKPLLEIDSVIDVVLDELQSFLDSLHDRTGLRVKLQKSASDNIQRLTRQRLSGDLARLTDEDRSDTDSQALEPPFVTALKLLIGYMSDTAAARREHLTVRGSE